MASNRFGVAGSGSGGVLLVNPPTYKEQLTQRDAIHLAAWLVVQSEAEPEDLEAELFNIREGG